MRSEEAEAETETRSGWRQTVCHRGGVGVARAVQMESVPRAEAPL